MSITDVDMKGLTGVEHLTLILLSADVTRTLEWLDKLAYLPLKRVDIKLRTDDAYPRSRVTSPAGLESQVEEFKQMLLRPWEDIVQEQKQENEAAAAKRDLEQGTIAGRRRAGQLRRGLNKAA